MVALPSPHHRRLSSPQARDVFHILGKGHIEQAHLTLAALSGPGETLTYPSGSPELFGAER